MTGTLTLRPAIPADFEAVSFFCDTALRRDYFVRRGQLKDMLAGRRHAVFLAEIDEVLVGLAVLTRPARLVNVLVHPAYRGLAIGRALIETTRPTEVRVKTDMSTGDPRAFYRRLGYRTLGIRNERGNIEVFQKQPDEPARETVA